MKKKIFQLFLLIGIFISCKSPEPNAAYQYNTDPHYAFGYAEFYGAYYLTENGNQNNTISLSLFSDSLKIDDEKGLVGFGQYLFLEDVFISASDSLLPTGTYTINSSQTPFTAYSGKNDTIDNEIYTIGASLSYYEKNPAKSTLKLISKGTFRVSKTDKKYTIVFDLLTSDSIPIKGSFTGELPHYDFSLINKNEVSRNKFPFRYRL